MNNEIDIKFQTILNTVLLKRMNFIVCMKRTTDYLCQDLMLIKFLFVYSYKQIDNTNNTVYNIRVCMYCIEGTKQTFTVIITSTVQYFGNL